MATEKSVYPIDKNRQLLYEATDAEKYVHKLFRLYADADPLTTDHIDIDVQIKYPEPEPENAGEPGAKRPRVAGAYPANDAYFRLLLRAKVDRFSRLQGGTMITARHTDSALDTFKKLIDNQILSCPVVTDHGFFGFIDMLDYVQYFTADYGSELSTVGYDFWKVLEKHSVFASLRVGDIIRTPNLRTGAHHSLSPGYSLYVAFEMLARERDLQRIAIVNADRQVANIVTQSGLIEFVEDSLRLLGARKHKPLRECPELFQQVERIYTDDTAIDGFTLMRKKGLWAVAVVDKATGKLHGNLSSRDLKGIESQSDWFQRLFEPVGKFLEQVASLYPQHQRPEDLIYVLPTDTIELVVKKLALYKIHRVYIVDGHVTRKPVGVVSLKDVLMQIIS